MVSLLKSETVLVEAVDEAAEKLDSAKLEAAQKRVLLPSGILDAEIQERLDQLKIEFKSWSDRKDAAGKRAAEAGVNVANARNARNNERRTLMDSVDANGRPEASALSAR